MNGLTQNPITVGLSSSSFFLGVENRPVSGAWKVKTATDPDTSPYNR